MPVSQSKLARLTPNWGILWISVCSFWLCGSIVANPIIYRLVPGPSRYEIRQQFWLRLVKPCSNYLWRTIGASILAGEIETNFNLFVYLFPGVWVFVTPKGRSRKLRPGLEMNKQKDWNSSQMLYGHTVFIGGKSQKDIYLRFITVASGGFKTRFKFNNIIATLCLLFLR